MRALFFSPLVAALLFLGVGSEPVPRSDAGAAQDAAAKAAAAADEARAAFAPMGILLDITRKFASVPAEVLVRGELLEYLVVNPRGAVHESAFLTGVRAININAALIALGAEQGQNARWKRRDPPPTPEELREGAPAYTVELPTGDGFFLYVAWKLDNETVFHRMEDLILDLRSGATMRRHRWVYLGSRMLRMRPDKDEEAFAAELEGNLINIAFFEQGNTLLTGALPECEDQTSWQSNFWLLPDRGSPVEIVFSREKLVTCPPDVEARLQPAIRVERREGR